MSSELRVEAGTLLAAWPDLMDPNFMHSVVFMCHHSDGGAHGYVTNRVSDLTLADLFPEDPFLSHSDFPVHIGGPVELQSFQLLHVVPDDLPTSETVDGRFWLGADLGELVRLLERDPERARRSVRALLGYSGWGAGQLDDELRTHSWVPAAADLEAVFGAPGEAAWRRVVRSVGIDGEDLEHQPPDVSWN